MDDTHSQLLELIRLYEMPQAAVDLLSANPPLVLAGTTGAGKDAVEEYIQTSSDWRHVVTHTTRPLRQGEINGKDYWFVDESEMLNMLNEQAFIEIKFLHNHQISGSSVTAYNDVLRTGYKPMMRIDIQGVEDLQQHISDIRPFFILPPDFDTWMQRLDARGHMSHVERSKRMHSAKEELEVAVRNSRFILVVNDEIPRVSKEIIGGATDLPSQRRNRELAQQLIDHIKSY